MLVTLSIVLFATPVTLLQYGGYGVALFGLNLHKEYKKNPEGVYRAIRMVISLGRE